MYKYETHLHTYPVSGCARAGVREVLSSYKELGYDGVFLTNHFLDGNINIDRTKPYAEKLAFYFSDYEEALCIGAELGIKVFLGVEMSYDGTDFLVYGLNPDWYFAHPEIMEMGVKEKLAFLIENGGYVVHAHPYRDSWYIDHIRLYPQSVQGVEVINANRTELENRMARLYAENYQLTMVAGTDNHLGGAQERFAGVMTPREITCEADYIEMIRAGEIELFSFEK